MLLFYTYMLMVYLPTITVIVGIPLLIAGIILQKKKKQLAKVFIIIGTSCIGICILFFLLLFVLSALGMGPIPNGLQSSQQTQLVRKNILERDIKPDSRRVLPFDQVLTFQETHVAFWSCRNLQCIQRRITVILAVSGRFCGWFLPS